MDNLISMKNLVSALLLALACVSIAEATIPPVEWTEHRRAMLVNASNDKAHGETIKKLQQALQAKGFVVTVIGDTPTADGMAYEKWVRSIPTMGVSLFYYCGRLETEMSPDGKRACYSMMIGGYKVIPPTRDPDLGRAQREDKPWLSLDRLSQKLDRNVSRENMVVVDCLGFDDQAKTGLSRVDLHGGASRLSGSELFTSFYPGKSAFHPSKDEPELGPKLAGNFDSQPQKGRSFDPTDQGFGLYGGAAIGSCL